MKSVILITMISLLIAPSLATKLDYQFASFADYHRAYNKEYKDLEEHEMREKIFYANLEKIRKINADPRNTWKAGINHMTDRTEEELATLRGYNRDLSFTTKKFTFNAENFSHERKFPESKDWVKEGKVSPVKDQKSCGSCWAFSVVGVLESHALIHANTSVTLAEQQLVDCVQNPHHCGGTGGCAGATQELGFDYVSQHGLTLGNNYPYHAKDGQCKEKQVEPALKIDSFVKLPENDYNALNEALIEQGPIAISVDASLFYLYDSGIFNGEEGKCGSTINHAVTLVGYGKESGQNGQSYYTIKNSWGSSWGEAGYIRFPREESAKDVKCEIDYHPEDGSGCTGGPSQIVVCGFCGMYSDSSYPVGVKVTQ
jgi:C1A family cysteine protease